MRMINWADALGLSITRIVDSKATQDPGFHWIPVTTRLPEAHTERVLVCHSNGYMASRGWMPSPHHALGVWTISPSATSAVEQGDHWSPLPAGPARKEDSDA